jgi:hypothetical protein
MILKQKEMQCPVCKLGTTKTGKSTLTVDIKGHLFFLRMYLTVFAVIVVKYIFLQPYPGKFIKLPLNR